MSDVTASTHYQPVEPLNRHAASALPLVDPILGREQEIGLVLALLDGDDVRALSLLGPGGVGKTRLALELMRQAADDFAHGACFVPLAAVRDNALVPFVVAQTLGIRESGSLPVTELLATWLRPRHFLLVLDNMEQVIGAASPWLVDLLASCPRLKVLVTSRIALNIAGEQRFRVPPLSVPDSRATDRLDSYASVALFRQRAHAVRSDFALDSGNQGTIAEICTRLDGLPLAVELAAARINVYSPVEILSGLTDRLALLSGDRRDAPARLRSLRDAIGWSYDLLIPEEQGLFCRLAVFVGGFTSDAAESVAGISPGNAAQRAAADTLATLIDHSLVEPVQSAAGTRFRMLETIREYSLAQLAESDEVDAAHDSHAAFYQQLALHAEPGLKGPDQARWLRRLEDEHGNLREAMSWLTAQDRVPEAIALFSNILHFMLVHAHFTESRQLLDAWFALPELAHPTRARALALLADGVVTVNSTHGGAAGPIRQLEEALGLLRELGDDKEVMLALNVLSFALWTLGDTARARVANDECMAMVGHFGDARHEAMALCHLACITSLEGDLQRARQALEEALTVARKASDQWMIAIALVFLGNLEFRSGEDVSRAKELVQESRIIHEELGDTRNLPVAYNILAEIARATGDFDTANSHLQTHLSIAQETGQVLAEGIAHLDLGTIAVLQHDADRALDELRQAIRLLRPLHVLPDIAACIDAFAALALASGDALQAARFLGASEWLIRGSEAPRLMLPPGEHERLMDAVQAVVDEETFECVSAEAEGWSVDEAVEAALAYELPTTHTDRSSGQGSTHGLSHRELEVLQLMANGYRNQQIADELFLSRRTVTSHVTSILGKLDLDSRTAAVSFAIRSGIA